MEILFLPAFIGLGFFVLFSFTGGFAAAIAAGGREDNSLVKNAGIGFVGWLGSWVIWSMIEGAAPTEEVTLPMIGTALLLSVVWARWQEHRRSSSPPSETTAAHG